jgi:putative cardiolipin synthase
VPPRCSGRLWPVAVFALAAGCATFHPYRGPVELTPPRPALAETALDRAATSAGFVGAGSESGFLLLESGEDALVARLAVANLAGRSLDLQTYIFDLDDSGKVVLARLLAAADRGVAVRLLLDDTTVQAHEKEWVAIDRHPNVDVRSFNPFRLRDPSYVEQLIEYLGNFSRLNHRMHNKVLVADASWTLVGGRNVADDYFDVSPTSNFRALDLLATGPIAAAAAAVFDRYWNSGWAVPVGDLGVPAAGAETLAHLRGRLARAVARRRHFERAIDLAPAGGPLAALSGSPRLVRAPARLIADDPDKIAGAEPRPGPFLLDLVRSARATVDIEAAYLILPTASVEAIGALVESGVAVRVLTNSLATNDVIAAHAGYVGTRRALLAAGVELHELRPEGRPGPERRALLPTSSRASLHSKAVVVDRQRLYVGSMNLDPRSIEINTEIGLFVDSSELAGRVADVLAEGREPANSWRVRLRREVEPGTAKRPEGAKPVWVEARPGGGGPPKLRHFEPEAGFWRRLKSGLLGLLPVEKQL